MLPELTAVLAQVPVNGKPEDYAAAIVEENCLGKQTAATRRHSLQHLRELYALDMSVPLFRVLRRVWQTDESSGALLALLACLARDPLLRATASTVVKMAEGTEFQRGTAREAVKNSIQDRLNDATLEKVLRNTASTWSQSGHLEGRTFKMRRTVQPSPTAVAFALYLAHVAGFGTSESFSCGWITVLDCGRSAALELAGSAKRLGLLDLRSAGDVIDLNLDRLDPYLFKG